MSDIKTPPMKLSELSDEQIALLKANHECVVFHEDHTICDILRFAADGLARLDGGERDWSGILDHVEMLLDEDDA